MNIFIISQKSNLILGNIVIIKEFSRPPSDKIHSFANIIKTKPQYMTKPFRRPKENGDYFDKNL